jgi:predicted NBD/HSP70 family sugar kinase
LDALLHAYQRQEKWAEELIGNFRYHLNKTILMICGLVDPQQIILGGEMLQKMQNCFDLSQIDERICFGGSHSEGCVSGAARIALRQAAVERIGQNAE